MILLSKMPNATIASKVNMISYKNSASFYFPYPYLRVEWREIPDFVVVLLPHISYVMWNSFEINAFHLFHSGYFQLIGYTIEFNRNTVRFIANTVRMGMNTVQITPFTSEW